MGFTSKQERNGADKGVETGGTPPSTDISGDISALAAKAVSVGAYRFGQQAHEQVFITPFGTGVAGGDYANPGGSMWEWDAGLAITEVSGEA